VVLAAVRRAGGTVTEINIDTDDALLGEYGMRIPVVIGPDGSLIAEGAIDDRTNVRNLHKALKRIGN
jgi:hypothetical protein